MEKMKKKVYDVFPAFQMRGRFAAFGEGTFERL